MKVKTSKVASRILPTHCRCRPLLLRLTTHRRHSTFGRTSLDEGSARSTDLYHTIQNTHIRVPDGIWNRIPNKEAAADWRRRLRGCWDMQCGLSRHILVAPGKGWCKVLNGATLASFYVFCNTCFTAVRLCDVMQPETQPYFLTYLLTYLFNYLLTYSMEQSPSWEANWFCS